MMVSARSSLWRNRRFSRSVFANCCATLRSVSDACDRFPPVLSSPAAAWRRHFVRWEE